MAEINDLNIVDASNTARFPEGQAPSTLNDGGRALEGLVARWHKDANASKASTGSTNAYVFAADQTLSAYYDGLEIGFDANFENTGAATLNVDAIGAITIKKHNDQDLAAGDIEAGQKVVVLYDGTNFQMVSPTARGGSPITTQGDVVQGDANGDPSRLSVGSAGTVLSSDGTSALWTPGPRNYIDGGTLSNNTLDATNDLDVAAVVAFDSTNTFMMELTAALGKQLDAVWAEGGTPATTVGGRFSAPAKAPDTWYHFFLIRKDADGTIDAGFDTSVTAANKPAGWSNFRRIGSVRTDSVAAPNSAIFGFTQIGDEFWWSDPPRDFNSTIATTATLVTLQVPTGIQVLATMNVIMSAPLNTVVYYSPTFVNDEAASGSAAPLGQFFSGGVQQEGAGQITIRTDTSAQIRGRATTGSSQKIVTTMWIDQRGKNA